MAEFSAKAMHLCKGICPLLGKSGLGSAATGSNAGNDQITQTFVMIRNK